MPFMPGHGRIVSGSHLGGSPRRIASGRIAPADRTRADRIRTDRIRTDRPGSAAVRRRGGAKRLTWIHMFAKILVDCYISSLLCET